MCMSGCGEPSQVRRTGDTAGMSQYSKRPNSGGLSRGTSVEQITYTIAEVAKLLQVSPLTIRRYWIAGKIPPPVAFGRVVRWRKSDLDAWLNTLPASALYESKAQ